MDIIGWIIIGGIAGWAADEMIGGDSFGILGNILLGIAGALVGGFLFGLVGISTYGFIGSLIVATIGAALVLWIASMFQGSRTRHTAQSVENNDDTRARPFITGRAC